MQSKFHSRGLVGTIQLANIHKFQLSYKESGYEPRSKWLWFIYFKNHLCNRLWWNNAELEIKFTWSNDIQDINRIRNDSKLDILNGLSNESFFAINCDKSFWDHDKHNLGSISTSKLDKLEHQLPHNSFIGHSSGRLHYKNHYHSDGRDFWFDR